MDSTPYRAHMYLALAKMPDGMPSVMEAPCSLASARPALLPAPSLAPRPACRPGLLSCAPACCCFFSCFAATSPMVSGRSARRRCFTVSFAPPLFFLCDLQLAVDAW